MSKISADHLIFALHCQYESVVDLRRSIDPVGIDQQHADDAAELQECMPFAAGARQARRLDAENGADLALANRTQHVLKARALVRLWPQPGQVRLEQGRKRIVRQMHHQYEQWAVFIPDHHEGYISWNVYQNNQARSAWSPPSSIAWDDVRRTARTGTPCVCAQCEIVTRSKFTAKEKGRLEVNSPSGSGGASATVLRLIRQKCLSATQVCATAPWVLLKDDLPNSWQRSVRSSVTCNPNQLTLSFQ